MARGRLGRVVEVRGVALVLGEMLPLTGGTVRSCVDVAPS